VTEIREPGFSIDLPGEWERVDSDEPGSLVYRDAADSGVVTVMLLTVRPAYAIADRARLHSDYMHHRLEFERGQVASLEQSEPVAWESDGRIEGSWSAVDAGSNGRQLHRVTLVGDIPADFCYEALDLDEAAFAERAATILDSAVVAVEPPQGDGMGTETE
jgi:hypothetical protein